MKDAVPAVLVVDDEQLVLDAIRRQHGRRFAIECETRGVRALQRARNEGPFAVVISDFNMPEMDGVSFLAAMRVLSPTTVRVLLTGQADLRVAMDAVTRGAVFRFVTKPCSAADFECVVRDAFEQHQLLVAERELLEQTLSGSLRVLADILALVSPDACGRAARARDLVHAVAAKLCPQDAWSVETAASLSQIGLVAVPPTVLERFLRGASLTPGERSLVNQAPATAATLIAQVPRMGHVAELIRLQARRFDGADGPDGPVGEKIPLGARILAAALALAELERRGIEPSAAVSALRERLGAFDPLVLDELAGAPAVSSERRRLTLNAHQLCVDMILDQDVLNQSGAVIVPRGHQLTGASLARLRGHIDVGMFSGPIRVVISDGATASRSTPAPALARLS